MATATLLDRPQEPGEILCRLQQLKAMIQVMTGDSGEAFKTLDQAVQDQYRWGVLQKAIDCEEMVWDICNHGLAEKGA